MDFVVYTFFVFKPRVMCIVYVGAHLCWRRWVSASVRVSWTYLSFNVCIIECSFIPTLMYSYGVCVCVRLSRLAFSLAEESSGAKNSVSIRMSVVQDVGLAGVFFFIGFVCCMLSISIHNKTGAVIFEWVMWLMFRMIRIV